MLFKTIIVLLDEEVRIIPHVIVAAFFNFIVIVYEVIIIINKT